MKTMKWLVALLLIALVTLTACKEKEEASPGETSSMPREEESEPEDTVAKNDEEGETAEEAVVESLLDTEAMVDVLGKYLLRPDDMPNKYFVPDSGEQRTATIRLIQDKGEIEAKTYVKETGRIDGWWLQLQRSSKADFAPRSIESSIELFKNADGAQTAMSPDHYFLHKDESRVYTPVAGGCDLGDNCEFYYSEKEEPTTELITAQYNVAFTYKNAFVWVMARGLDIDMDADYVMDAARVVFEKLQEAPTQ